VGSSIDTSLALSSTGTSASNWKTLDIEPSGTGGCPGKLGVRKLILTIPILIAKDHGDRLPGERANDPSIELRSLTVPTSGGSQRLDVAATEINAKKGFRERKLLTVTRHSSDTLRCVKHRNFIRT
jgi:hypothetical protein